jgi:hypothetical protein
MRIQRSPPDDLEETVPGVYQRDQTQADSLDERQILEQMAKGEKEGGGQLSLGAYESEQCFL